MPTVNQQQTNAKQPIIITQSKSVQTINETSKQQTTHNKQTNSQLK